MPFATLNAPDHNILHLLLDDLPLLHPQPLRKLTHLPHRLFRIVLLGVLLDAVVGQMRKSIVDVIEGVLIVGEAEIALVIEPDGWRGEVLDGHPLADIEFPALNQKGVLYILLDYELGGLAKAVISNIVDIIEATYSSSSRHD